MRPHGRWILIALSGIALSGCGSGHQELAPGPMQLLSAPRQLLLDGATTESVEIGQIVNQVEPGEVVIISENHGFGPHHQNQVDVLNALAKMAPSRLKISVGMEFFPRFAQDFVDQYLSGMLPEDVFLTKVEWGKGISFDNYRRQVLIPNSTSGFTVALNARRALTSKIAKCGLDSLTDEERSELPKDFTLGNSDYLERFREIMGGHVKEDQLDRYFAAQSAWDESMSTSSCEFIKSHPQQTLVVIVGDFHAAYGGGLPERMRARGCGKITVISQLQVADISQPRQNPELSPHPKWGARGQYVWAVESKENEDAFASPFFNKSTTCN